MILGSERPQRRARDSIVVRLLAAFVIVSLLPILVLAALSIQEAASDPAAHSSAEASENEAGEQGAEREAADSEHGTIAGVPIEYVELGVAAMSLVLSGGAALYVGRTIGRPIRSLEPAMPRGEGGALAVTSSIANDDEIGHLASAFDRMVEGLRREALVRDLFGQYVSPEVARLAIEQHGQLEGQVTVSTVLFVDIRRFTGLAEVLPPARLIGTLNRYFERMLAVVQAEGGIVNKFGGDSLLAVFGSPLNPSPDHAERAVRAAIGMRQALAEFNREQAADEMPQLRVGFGIATGELVAGNVGSERKREYTVIGDPVNLAARLQELTTELGADVLMSGATAERAREVTRLRSLGRVEVRGRAEPAEVYEAIGLVAAIPVDVTDTSGIRPIPRPR